MRFAKHLKRLAYNVTVRVLALSNYILLLKSVVTKTEEYEVCSKLKI